MFKKNDSAHSHYMCMINIRRVLQRKEIIGKRRREFYLSSDQKNYVKKSITISYGKQS